MSMGEYSIPSFVARNMADEHLADTYGSSVAEAREWRRRRPTAAQIRRERRRKAISACVQAGIEAEAIAERFGVAVCTARKLICEAGGRRRKWAPCKPWSAEEDAMVSARVLSNRELAEKLGRTKNSICGRRYRLRLGWA